MKLECLKKDIENAVEIVSRVVSHSATLPVLRCIVFNTQDNTIIVRGTNLEIGVEKVVTGEIKKKGSVAVPAQILLSTLKTISQPKITLEEKENTILISSGESKTTIKTIPIDDFPNIPKPETKIKHTLTKKDFITGVRSVLYSASTSLIKPELASVYIYQEGGKLIFAATDSFRLAEKKISYKSDTELPDVIMPVKNTSEFIRIIESQTEETLDVYIDENQYAIKTPSLYVTSRIIDGSFPDYKSILPKETKTEIIVLKEDLFATLKKAQIFSDKFGKVTFHIYPEKKTCTINAQNNDIGEVFDSINAAITGEDLDISFNHKYLIDMFQSITTDSISLTFAGIGRPLVVRGVGDETFTYLVMPMNK